MDTSTTSTETPEDSNPLATRYIGRIFEISESSPRFSLEVSKLEDPVGNVEVGAYTLVKYQNIAVLGQITELANIPGASFPQSGRLQLLASINLESCELIPGISRIPSLGSNVFIASAGLIQQFFSPSTNNSKPSLYLANLGDESGPNLEFTPEMLFSRHCAVLGTTGGGKSHTVARLLEETLKLRSKIILIDATGEYAGFKSKHVKHVHVGNLEVDAHISKQVAVPYYHLTEADLMGIFKPQGQSQGPKLRAAMKSLKLSILVPSLSFEGNVIKMDKDRRFFDSEYARNIKAIDNPLAIFDISKLAQQIENECVRPTRSAVEPFFWGGINQIELAHCTPLVVRVNDIINSDEVSCIFNPGKLPSLLDEIEEFLSNPQHRMLRISLESLPFLYNTREVVSNAIGRQIMMLARQGKFKKAPVVLFLDEAHQFLKEHLESGESSLNIDSLALIAKEGRKYGLSLCLSTQRPRDIPESILSQVGTFIVHRIANITDRGIIESASATIEHGTLSILPMLGPGMSIIMGAAVPFTLIAKIAMPDHIPESETPSLNDLWRI